MTAVRTVTYQFNVNGVYTKKMEVRRGLRQGDPISPLLFVVIMEYLHRKLKGLRAIPNFNFHSKCEKDSDYRCELCGRSSSFLKGGCNVSQASHGEIQ